MFGLDNSSLLILSMGISAVLYFVLALYKKHAYIWWAIGGFVICIPIAMMIPILQELLHSSFFSKINVFIAIYVIIYISFWLIIKRNVLTEEERKRKEKLEEYMFDGFMALKEKKIDDAYYCFRKANLADPDNYVIKTMLSSFEKVEHGLVRKNKILDKWYRFLLFFRRKKKKVPKSTDLQDQGVKKVEGKIVK